MRDGSGWSDRVFSFAVIAGGVLWGVLAVGAWLPFMIGGRKPAAPSLSAPFVALVHPGQLAAAWGQGAPSPWLYWSSTVAVALTAAAAGTAAFVWKRRGRVEKRGLDLRGCASRGEVHTGAGRATLSSRAATL